MRLACLRSESLLLFISSVLISLLFWIPTDTWWDPHSLRPADCPQQSRTSILIPVLSNKGFSACSLSLLAHAWAFFFSFWGNSSFWKKLINNYIFADIGEDTIIQKTRGTFSPAQAQNLLLLLLLAPKVLEPLADSSECWSVQGCHSLWIESGGNPYHEQIFFNGP
jgi:hypothetical protein